jgi:isoleucyl-tRNA synthetase
LQSVRIPTHPLSRTEGSEHDRVSERGTVASSGREPYEEPTIDSHYSPLEVEPRVLRRWEDTRAFDRLRELRAGAPEFRFLDGPITANNPMGVHHAWGRTLKDAVIRYRAMQGQSCRYQNGFDCQGLWVEVEVERALGFKGKPDIEAFGLANFSRACRERVDEFAGVIAEQSKRLGQWMDWDNSYFTYSDDNIEAIWLFLQKCFERGYLYEGHVPLPWCTRCGTSLSQHEMLGSYVETEDLSLYVTANLLDGSGRALVLWTTTPWTLAANVAAAVHPELKYEEVEWEGKRLVLSAASRARLGVPDGAVQRELPGSELVGLEFETFFPEFPVQRAVRHVVIPWKEIDPEEGSGIVHIAPGCGPEDYELSKELNLDVITPIDGQGDYVEGFGWLEGKNAALVAEEVTAHLRAAGRVVEEERYTHSVPVCWRCKSHVLFRLVYEWFISVDEVREPMLAAAATVEWEPPHIGSRMDDWLHNMGDWCISRKRYWGLPLPFYRCEDCDELSVVGSRAELRERALQPDLVDSLPELHRPWIDEITIRCKACEGPAARVPEVGDCWLDAGIVPFSTLGYFDDREAWERRFPAEWISEMREQVRLWYYSMLFMSVVLEGRAPYERTLSYERVISETGEKFSKTGHMIRFDDAVAQIGADPIRYLFCRQPPGVEARFGYEAGAQMQRRLAGLWNIASFFDTYASIDRVELVDPATLGDALHVTDRWLLARTAQLVDATTGAMGHEDTPTTVREAEQFIEEVSNWYVRVNRRRFWRAGNEADKVACHSSLFEALRAVTLVLAPIVPFVTDELWQQVVRPFDAGAPESVHHARWPVTPDAWRDAALLDATNTVRTVISAALRLREEAKLRVRQPLPSVTIVAGDEARSALAAQRETIASELNVKRVEFTDELSALEEDHLALDFKRAGPVLRKQLDAVSGQIDELTDDERAAAIEAIRLGRSVRLPGWTEDLPAEIFTAERHPAHGVRTAETPSGIVVALDTRLDDALVAEGWARDVIRHVQTLRKDAGLAVTDRIRLWLRIDDTELGGAVRTHLDAIGSEVLATEVELATGPDDAARRDFAVGGKAGTAALTRA